jgi:hypothetical protein
MFLLLRAISSYPLWLDELINIFHVSVVSDAYQQSVIRNGYSSINVENRLAESLVPAEKFVFQSV